MAYCKICGAVLDDAAVYCSKCGAKQEASSYSGYEYQYQKKNNENLHQENNGMSTNKILSFIALGLSICSIIVGGVFAEIAAIVISIIVLNTRTSCDKEAKTISKVALVISIILIIAHILIVMMVGELILMFSGNLFDSIGSAYY